MRHCGGAIRRNATGKPNARGRSGELVLELCDVSSMASIREFAERFTAEQPEPGRDHDVARVVRSPHPRKKLARHDPDHRSSGPLRSRRSHCSTRQSCALAI